MNNVQLKEKINIKSKYFQLLTTLVFSLISATNWAQQPTVSASIDTAKIKIGEQITYQVKVETDSTDLVIFPEGNTFAPLEVVASLGADTTRAANNYKLLKEYKLTVFDSGSYTIPSQKIIINNKPWLTDSLKVAVADVAVDTTKQAMYPIKPSVEVSKSFSIPNWVWWTLAVAVLLGIVAFFFTKKQLKKKHEKKLPPFEQAMNDLDALDKSTLLKDKQVKEYYSRLTSTLRHYLDEKVYDGALESTTTDLIAYLELQRKTDRLSLHPKTLENLKKILNRADLAKFANSKPDVITAKEDRDNSRKIITDVKSSIPEPTEEDLMLDEEYRKQKQAKKRKKTIIIAITATVVAILVGLTVLISTKGFTYVVDTYFGNASKELLEGDWVRSAYGTPEISVTTPDVLVRKEMKLSEDATKTYANSEHFEYGSLVANFYTGLTTRIFSKKGQFDLKTGVDGIYKDLEKRGAKNIVMKQEDFSTINGAKGVKVYGTLEVENPINGDIQSKKYSILNFAQGGGFQQVTVIYAKDDKYASEIASRIINSVELIKTSN
ncbi:BatD family protein [Zunongwangia sp.]|uniref:BatD family protein n=1 Tax=Zunongwangia sp. TaxID=1965325 RepID=UPI003AA879F4